MSIQCKTTRYGLSPRAAGWDIPGDSGTDDWQGCFGNKLNTSSCALTVSMEAALAATLIPAIPSLDFNGNPFPNYPDSRLLTDVNGQLIPGRLKPYTLLKIAWPGTPLVQYRTFDDRAPESDERCDLFYPWKDDPSIPDFGQVSLV
jgi:hypothetical protein